MVLLHCNQPSFLGSGNRSLLPRKTIYYQSKVLIFIGKGYTTVCLASLLPHFYQIHNGLKYTHSKFKNSVGKHTQYV